MKDNRFGLIAITFCLLSCDIGKNVYHQNDSLNGYTDKYFKNYHTLYHSANDSIAKWVNDSLAIIGCIYGNPVKLDSIFCFNKDSTRLYTTLNKRKENFKDATSDLILEFGGALIHDKWYFFFLSGSMVVPREMYKKDIHTTLSFRTLSKLAHKELHSKAFVFAKNGTYKVDEEFFKKTFNSTVFKGCIGNDTEACYDSMTLVHCKEKYNYKLSREEIEEIKKAMKESESIN